jgi:hypothetical protein
MIGSEHEPRTRRSGGSFASNFAKERFLSSSRFAGACQTAYFFWNFFPFVSAKVSAAELRQKRNATISVTVRSPDRLSNVGPSI